MKEEFSAMKEDSSPVKDPASCIGDISGKREISGTGEIPGVSNWELTVARCPDHIVILRARTCDRTAALPDELFGLPVTELGDHALAPGAREVRGEAVRITCGRADGEFDNAHLCDLTLPSPLQIIRGYAFMNCRALETLHLSGALTVLGADAFMNCRDFAQIDLRCEALSASRALSLLTEELPRELTARIREARGELRLVFPEYREVTDENVPNHYFSYVIAGAGYPYHFLGQKKLFSLAEYDSLWEKFLAAEHEESTALRLAWGRVRCPLELSAEAGAAYEAWLQKHTEELCTLVLAEKDTEGLRMLLQRFALSREELSKAQAQARSSGFTEAAAILLEEQHRRFPAARTRSFEL